MRSVKNKYLLRLLNDYFLNHNYHNFRYFCKPKPDNINYVPEMENCGLWQDISAAKNLVSFNSDSLIYDLTNNYVESYNSIVAKFVGGKRINYSLRGTYTIYYAFVCF